MNNNKNLKKPVLWKDITWVLIVKGILFFIIWLIFFSHPASKHINSNKIFVEHLLSQTQTKES